jgi:hypothetical protein
MSKQINALLKQARENNNAGGDVRVMPVDDALGLVPGNTIAMRANCVAAWLTVPLSIRRKIASDFARSGRPGSVLEALLPADAQSASAFAALPASQRFPTGDELVATMLRAQTEDAHKVACVDVALHFGVTLGEVAAALAVAYALPGHATLADEAKAFMAALPPLIN